MKNINKKGFTLAEILIVIAIVAILTIVALTQYKTQISKAFDKKRKDHLYRLKVAIEEYYVDNNCYPSEDLLEECGQSSLSPYLSQIPCDPQSGEPYEYVYDETLCPQWFKIYTVLDYTGDSKITEVGCAAGCGPDTDNDGTSDYNYGVSSNNVIVGERVTATPTPSPGPTPGGEICSYPICYGCVSGVCVQVATYGQEVCSPNYSDSDCSYNCEMYPDCYW